MSEKTQAKCHYCGKERPCGVWMIGRRKRYVCADDDCLAQAAGDEYDADQAMYEEEAEREREEEEAMREAYEDAQRAAEEDGYSRYGGPGRW